MRYIQHCQNKSNLRKLAEETDYLFVMVTNQDGLGTDAFPEDTFWPAHQKMLDTLAGENVTFHEILIDRTFEREDALTRKPHTGMLAHYLRDGTIIHEPEDEQIDSLEKLAFLPGAISKTATMTWLTPTSLAIGYRIYNSLKIWALAPSTFPINPMREQSYLPPAGTRFTDIYACPSARLPCNVPLERQTFAFN